MKFTLLQLTQDILSGMSSDEVNSISDTTESMQVATIVKQKYFDIVNRVPLPDHEQLVQLDPSLDLTSPVLMYVPDGIASIKWVKYFNSNTEDTDDTVPAAPGYQYVTILPIEQFIDMTNKFNPTEDDVETFTFSDTSNNFNGNYTFYYKTDKQPSYCTCISNFYMIFDSFDITQDTTLQASKTMAWGRIIPHFSMVDDFIPNLSEEQFQLLLNEAKALAFYELKQQPHQLAMQETKRGWSNVQKNKSMTNKPTYFDAIPNYGRQNRGYRSGVSMFKERGWDQV